MFTPIAVGWLTCEDPGCLGVRLANASVCLAHAANLGLDEFEVELRRISEQGASDVRGVRLSGELLGRLLAAAPRDSHGHVIVRNAQFDRTTFDCVARFNQATFEGETKAAPAVPRFAPTGSARWTPEAEGPRRTTRPPPPRNHSESSSTLGPSSAATSSDDRNISSRWETRFWTSS
jgi:hypothetical protein